MARKLSRKKEFYVYALLDPRKPGPFYYGHWKFSQEPFYIGKGKGSRAEKQLENCSNRHSRNRIDKLRLLNFEPILVFKRINLTEMQAFDLESKLIELIGMESLNAGPLTNLCKGGEGVSGVVWTEARKEAKAKQVRNWLLSAPNDVIEDMKVKQLKGLKEYHSKLSARDKDKWIQSLKQAWENMPLNKKLERNKKISRTQLSIDSEERYLRYIRRSQGQRNKPAHVEKLRRQRISNSRKARSPEQILDTCTRTIATKRILNKVPKVRYKGKSWYFMDLVESIGSVKYNTAYMRYYKRGWNLHDAVTTPT